eukprot:TRINITY_DN36302_c0_g1_i1.p1 TRINITY_DN36302_c0_g1~~TRINITY_DN36302_c0_g1_i1.p1  ORF type:complete len:361 (-),score=46.82 TRINITY_DN36302_c0_g1_i1:52-1134(-)
MSDAVATAPTQAGPAGDMSFLTHAETGLLPVEAWCKVLSFVVRSHSLPRICPISCFFRKVAIQLLSWDGASVCVRAPELEEEDGRPRFDPLIPQWSLCSHVFADFKDAHVGVKRKAVRRCFSLLGQHCTVAIGLYVRNWCLMERDGLAGICERFPSLRYLELSACDYLSRTNCARIFTAHPALLSLRATFSPKSALTLDVVEAAPRGLMAFGFVNFGSAGQDVLSALLARCPLEHLWLARTAAFSPAISGALAAAPRPLKTLSLPETIGVAGWRGESEGEWEAIKSLTSACPELEMICCWGDGQWLPLLADNFERVDCKSSFAHRIILRRRGSVAKTCAHGGLWSPHSLEDDELFNEETV